MILARSEKYNTLPSPTALWALRFTPLRTTTVLVTCVHTATYPTLSVWGWSCAIRLQPSHLFQHGNKHKEGRHTILKVNFRETLSPNPFSHRSWVKITKQAQEWNKVLSSSSSCLRSSGLCFLGNRKEHHNSLLASKWHIKMCLFFLSSVFYPWGISLNSELTTQQKFK